MTLRSLLLSCFGSRSRSQPAEQPRQEVKDRPHQSRPNVANDDKQLAIDSRSLDEVTDSASSESKHDLRGPTKALCVVAKHTYGIATDIPYPTINSPDEIIIRTHSVGLNPIDWKSVDYNFCMPSFPWIGGREVAGTVEEVGANVRDLAVGDRVWASTYYRDRRAGTFQEYCVVPQHTVLPLPKTLSMDSGACLGVAALTAAMTLWKWLGVPMPTSDNKQMASKTHVLIWGGSTVTGQFTIQLARLSGLTVITVTSAKTSGLAHRLGAHHVITRDGKTNNEIVGDIRALAGNDLTLAIDIVGNATGAACLTALSNNKPGTLAPLAFLKNGEPVPEHVTIAPVEMKRFIIEDGNRVYAETLNRLVAEGRVLMPDTEVLDGGFEAIETGLEKLKRGDMNGKKLVVRLQ